MLAILAKFSLKDFTTFNITACFDDKILCCSAEKKTRSTAAAIKLNFYFYYFKSGVFAISKGNKTFLLLLLDSHLFTGSVYGTKITLLVTHDSYILRNLPTNNAFASSIIIKTLMTSNFITLFNKYIFAFSNNTKKSSIFMIFPLQNNVFATSNNNKSFYVSIFSYTTQQITF